MEAQKDKFTQLVDDLADGTLSLTHIQIAIRTYIRQREDVPIEIKTILCGSSITHAGLIYQIFKLIPEVIGNFELAILRAKQK